MPADPTWLLSFDGPHVGIRVAVKDLLDVTGTVTTAGCKAVERRAQAATGDAACLTAIRAGVDTGALSIVGKTNLHELAFGADGINRAYGTPRNPIDPDRIPGGSSSGSAVAVAVGQADVGIGSDTGGSIRIPAACCGIVGLKTTHGRVPVGGCWPLAPFLDTIGPLGRTVADVVEGMELLEPGFVAETRSCVSKLHRRVGRLRPAVDVEPDVDAAVEALLQRLTDEAGIEVVNIELTGWESAHSAGLTVLLGEAWRTDRHLLRGSGVSSEIAERLRLGESISDAGLVSARRHRQTIVDELTALATQHRLDAFATPTMPMLPPPLSSPNASLTAFTRLANMAGGPALSLPAPVPARHRRPATAHLAGSLQLVGLPGDDAVLTALAGLLDT